MPTPPASKKSDGPPRPPRREGSARDHFAKRPTVTMVGRMPTETVEVIIPDGHGPGSRFPVCTPSGMTTMVTVPPKTKPGQAIEINVPIIQVDHVQTEMLAMQTTVVRTEEPYWNMRKPAFMIHDRPITYWQLLKFFAMTLITFTVLTACVVLIMAQTDPNSGSGVGSGGSFGAGTQVKMANGTWKSIEEVRIGEEVFKGGRVVARMEFEASLEELYLYSTVGKAVSLDESVGNLSGHIIVAGGHAVWENGQWLRVRDAAMARQIGAETYQSAASELQRVFDLDVVKHRLVVLPKEHVAHDGVAPMSAVLFADFSEVDSHHHLVAHFEKTLLNALGESGNEDIEL